MTSSHPEDPTLAGIRLLGLDSVTAAALRTRAASGRTAPIDVDEPDAYPCMHCLRDAHPGEQVWLVSYNPIPVDGSYSGAGPIFLHVDACPAYTDDGAVPPQLARRLLSIRAFDARHTMRAADVVAGPATLVLARRLLADPEVAYLHVHNARPGCWAARLERA
ncbi:hypothetical protein BH20ACT5_BH20ACT5_08200 [soil metagenome]